MALTIADTNDRFLLDGRPFFYLADTVWAAFPNLPIELWPEFLSWRRRQGFTAVQISILPIEHDTSRAPDNLSPFEGGPDRPDFSRLNRAYFDKAENMVAMVVEAGLVPVLGVLWGGYVPDTPFCNRSPVPTGMPLDAVRAYTGHVVERFGGYDPVFFISGDTGFRGDREPEYYMTALEIVRDRRPDLLLTMHLGTAVDLPDEFGQAVDFYMYQSGHRPEQKTPYELARKHANAPITRPVVNGEPCYEGHAKVSTGTRFQRYDVRKAIWQSLLSGAGAGTAYGAHGVWSCHLPHMEFMARERKFDAYPWDRAIRLEGAWDAAQARWLFEDFSLQDTRPADLLVAPDEEVAVSASADTIALYSPQSYDLQIRVDLTGYRCRLMDLETRRWLQPRVDSGPTSRLHLSLVARDSLFVATR